MRRHARGAGCVDPLWALFFMCVLSSPSLASVAPLHLVPSMLSIIQRSKLEVGVEDERVVEAWGVGSQVLVLTISGCLSGLCSVVCAPLVELSLAPCGCYCAKCFPWHA